MSKNKTLNPSQLTEILRSAGKVIYRANVLPDVTPDEALDPKFYSLVSNRFKSSGFLPEIEIVPEDVSWYMKGIIVSHGRTHAVVKKVLLQEFESEGNKDIDDNAGYTIKFRGAAKWSIMSPKGDVVREGMSKEEAALALKEHLEIIGA